MSVDLSIVIVNFNSARFVHPLLESIRRQEWTVDGRPGAYEVIVVENASKGDDAARLAEIAADDGRVRVIQNTANVGYGQANNQGFAAARGRLHMVLNPDTVFLPGCFQALVTQLEDDPGTAMVGPLAFMDPLAQCMMPPNELPTPELFELQTRAQVDAEAARLNLAERTRFAYEYWAAEGPYPMEMLSGSCLVFRRGLFEDERPFDPGFPLYYEDTDLFMRLRRRGEKLVHVPAAKMLHYWSQSADSHARGAQYRGRISARRYYQKYFGEEGLRVYEENFARSMQTKDEGAHVVPFECEPLEAGPETPVFPVDEGLGNYFVEFAGNPIFTLAVGMFPDQAGPFSVSQLMWEQLGPGSYWIRIIDRTSLETLRVWVVEKPA